MNVLIAGQCVAVCPVGGISLAGMLNHVVAGMWQNRDKVVIVQTTSAVRAALGNNNLHCRPVSLVTGKDGVRPSPIGF